MSAKIAEAVSEATQAGKLRPNSVDSLSGRNSGDNLGAGTPVVHFEEWLSDDIEVRLTLKGGGCENTSTQYSLPCELNSLGRADRNLEGVRKCLLHAVAAPETIASWFRAVSPLARLMAFYLLAEHPRLPAGSSLAPRRSCR